MSVERARLVKAQADAVEFRLARERGEYVEREAVRSDWIKGFVQIRQHVLAAESKIAQRLSHLDRKEVAQIGDILRETLTDASEAVEALGLETDI